MKRTELVHVAVAETSVIVRSGLVAVLKRMPDLIIQPVEITSLEGLQNCMQGHQPDILIINPKQELRRANALKLSYAASKSLGY